MNNTIAIANVLLDAYNKVINLSDISDGVAVYSHNIGIAKALRLMMDETNEYVKKVEENSNG